MSRIRLKKLWCGGFAIMLMLFAVFSTTTAQAAAVADGQVTITVETNTGIAGSGGSVSRNPIGTLVSGTIYKWNNNTNVTFTMTPAAGYVLHDVVWNGTPAGAVSSLTKNIKNGDNFTLKAVFRQVSNITFTYSSTPAGAPNGTPVSAGPFDVNSDQSFTVNAPANWIIDTVKVDATTGTAMTLSCNISKTNCTFSYNVGTTNHIFYVAMLPYDNPTVIVTPFPVARTTTSLTVTPPVISDADGVQNTTYHLYDTDGTSLLTSNTTGQFTGLTEAKIYWISVTAQTKNATTGQWEDKGTTLQQASTSAPVYTITSSIALGSGSVTINGVAVASWPNVTNLEGNQSATFTFVPATDYALTDVKLNGVSQGPQNPFTIPNITANKTVEIYFKRVWTIAVSAGANGAISPANPAKVVDGGSQTFTIIPATGADVLQVLVDGAAQGAITSYTFTNVTSDHTIAATFVLADSDMGKYSIVPPFIASAIKPNLLLMLDNSASMYDLAYSTAATYCYDESYSDASAYDGYFTQSEIYSYNAVDNKFESGATLPGGCTFTTSYMCVNMTGISPNRLVTGFIASGKFLNWLTASKFDVQKKVLTGGKFNTTYNVLEAESRGCVGRRFIKAVPGVAGLTFTIRGPNAYDPDFVNQSTQGGNTRIEIYDKAYNKAACLAAAAAWVDPNAIGDVQNITRDCIGTSTDSFKTDAYNHIIHQCFWALTGDHNLSNMNALQGDCENVYSLAEYNNDPSKITKENGADAVCSSVITHPDWGRGNTLGFLGRCATYSGAGPHPWSWDDTCSDTEIRDYCSGTSEFDVIDPSNASTVVSTSPVAVPSFIMDAGVTDLGKIAGSFLVRVALTAQPSGIIQDYKEYIQFGAMVFNRDGSGAECNDGVTNTTSSIKCAKNCSVTTTKQCYVVGDCPAGESCVLSAKTDGSKVVSYVGFDPVGDHTTGLINTIDNIQATSWTPWAEAYYNAIGYFGNRTDLRLQTADFDITKNPSDVYCRLNNILIISDGGSTADQKDSVAALAGVYNDGDGQTGACIGYAGSKNLDDLAWLAKNRNIKTFNKTTASSDAPVNNNEFITTYTVFTGVGTGADECNPQTLMSQTAVRGGTTPYAVDGSSAFRDALDDAFKKISASSASGTAASILSNSEGSGAALMQAVFYPKKEFDKNAAGTDTSAQWLGELQSFWYFLDPYLNKSSIREDSDENYYLNLKADKILQFQFDTVKKKTQVYRFVDTNGDGLSDGPDAVDGSGNQVAYDPDFVKSLWRAGRKLWLRDPMANPVRKIYTTLDGTSLTDFTTALKDDATARTYLRMPAEADAQNLIEYISGVEKTGLRGRTVAINSCTNNRLKSCTVANVATDCPSSTCTPYSSVWKLGDIISSTPKLVSPSRLNNYNMAPPNGYNDNTYKSFFETTAYQSRGMAFVGANDGMLHAFRMGILKEISDRVTKAKLTYPDSATMASSSSNLGQEEWAFAPRHALPYLKYLSDKNYTHLYYVDRSPTIIDASIGVPVGCADDYAKCTKSSSTWKTVLLGGMGIGGASRTKTPSPDCTDCIKSPIDDIGYSSYFALDITDPTTPSLMWEFSGDPAARGTLGLTTTGPAIVRVAARQDVASGTTTKPDHSKNGKWFAVFASGATGKINATDHSLSGISDQNLHIFILDLKTGALVKKIDTGIANAFAGTLSTAVFDADRNNTTSDGFYSDDVVYIGYTKKDAATGSWTKGGVLRLTVPETTDPTAAGFANMWHVSDVITETGPITTSISKLQDRRNKNFWLFFGTGRYFYRTDDTTDTLQTLYGVKEPCYSAVAGVKNDTNDILLTCTDSVDSSTLVDQSSVPTTLAATNAGWKINLDVKGKYCSMDQSLTCTTDANCLVGSVNKGVCTEYLSERIITDPIAMANGAVFFTSFKPSADVCAYGGSSLIWALRYDTGDVPPAKAMQGQALMQVSTGAFAEIKLSDAFKNAGNTRYDGRRLAVPITGVPPTAQGLSLFTNPPPAKKFIHVREK